MAIIEEIADQFKHDPALNDVLEVANCEDIMYNSHDMIRDLEPAVEQQPVLELP